MKEHLTGLTVHEGKRRFICNQCNMCFSYNQSLKQHVNRTHLKVFNYKCKLCDKAYAKKSSLNDHIRSKHIHASHGNDIKKVHVEK